MDDFHEFTLKFSKTKRITKKSLKQAFLARKRLLISQSPKIKLDNYESIKTSTITSSINNIRHNPSFP